jgi:hypothetical protein
MKSPLWISHPAAHITRQVIIWYFDITAKEIAQVASSIQ